MKKRSKLGWIGLFISTVILLAVFNFLDARVFNQLNPFNKDASKASETYDVKGTSHREIEAKDKTPERKVAAQ